MAAFSFFRFLRRRDDVRSAYDETTPLRMPNVAHLSASWSQGSEGKPACRWKA